MKRDLPKVAADFLELQASVARPLTLDYARRGLLHRQGRLPLAAVEDDTPGMDIDIEVDDVEDAKAKVEAELEKHGVAARKRIIDGVMAQLPTPEAPDIAAFQGVVFGWLRQARVIDIEPRTYAALYNEADIYTENVLCGGDWTPGNDNPEREDYDETKSPPPGGYPTWDAWNTHYIDTLVQHGKDLAYPEHLPFDAVYLGYGGVGLSEVQRGWRGIGGSHVLAAELVGHLLTRSGLVIEFVRVTTGRAVFREKGIVQSETTQTELMLYPLRDPAGTLRGFAPGLPISMAGDKDGPWYAPYSLMPWVLTALVDLVNSYRTFVVQDTSLFYRTEYAARGKKTYGMRKAIPPPFYTIRLQDELTRETGTTRAWRKAAKPEHRFDVRGHERIKVARGPMPLDDKLRAKLTKRGYRIFTIEPLDQEHWRLLAERRLPPKRPDEWIAFKRKWVTDYTKGPEGAPYIPAVRRVPKRRRVQP